MDSYVGKYVIQGEIIEIIPRGDKLKAIYQNKKIKMVPISQTKFRLNNVFIDVNNIELEFFVNLPDEENTMIITMGDHFVCPRYDNIEEIPSFWKELEGKYDAYSRVHSEYTDSDLLGNVEIYIDDIVLYMSDGKVLRQKSSTELIIVGGIFDGETMTYDKKSGNITWQHTVYKPASES